MSRLMAIVAGGLVVIALFVSYARSRQSGLPVLAELPAFELIDSSEKKVSLADLQGHPWVADFIFTNCPGVCPMMAAQMQRLQSALERRQLDGVQLVSITVDPKNDTPEVLRAYAERYGAEPERWRFLTGERSALYDLIGNGFKLSVADREEDSDGQGLITHSDRFALIDASGRVRGYYPGTEREGVDRLLADLEKLAR